MVLQPTETPVGLESCVHDCGVLLNWGILNVGVGVLDPLVVVVVVDPLEDPDALDLYELAAVGVVDFPHSA